VADTLTVSELCSSIERAVLDAFPDEVWVSGAISGLKRSPVGHVYFDLVDPGRLGDTATASVSVALFAAKRTLVNRILTRAGGAVRMTDGTEIRIRGEVSFYPRGGRVQLLMSLIDPAYTLGQLAEARDRLLRRLADEGLLDANRRHLLPALPLRVALVTSAGSAAHADFCDELARSGYRFELTVVDTRVQGTEAVENLVWALREAAAERPDVIALVRGGGARTDLAPFDHELVARAVASSPVPVLTGIGHEIDRSVCDDVAHTAAKTPTACAGLIVAQVRGFESRVEAAAARLGRVADHRLEVGEQDLHQLARRVARAGVVTVARTDAVLHDTVRRVQRAGLIAHRRAEERLDGACGRLRAAAPVHLHEAEHRLELATVRLRASDPAETLRRGWSITRGADGRLVTDPAQVAPGERLVTRLAGGELTSFAADRGGPDPSGADRSNP
jgi:exodeoxyribonuclease VII large subunit